MKTLAKTAVFILMSLGVSNIHSQGWVYHNVGDTIDNMDTIYWIPEWYRTFMNGRNDHYGLEAGFVGQTPGELLMRCYTPKAIQVIGIASAFVPHYGQWAHLLEEWPIDSTHEPEYLRLYQAYPDTLVLMLNFRIRLTDPYRALRKDEKKRVLGGIYCCDSIDEYENYYRIYEYYTEKPVTVTDTFFIGGTKFSVKDEEGLHDDYLEYYGFGGWRYPGTCLEECTLPEQLYMLRRKYGGTTSSGDYYPPGTPTYKMVSRYLYTFPILLIDSTYVDPNATYTCPDVENFRAAFTWESGGTMLWNVHARHREWQVRICNEGQPPDSYLVDTCVDVPYFTVEGLQSHTHYTAYARAKCEHYGDTLFSEWTEGIGLYTVVDVMSPDNYNGFVQLQPNPATETVQVLSSFPMSRVEIYDLTGKKVYDKDVSGIAAVVDVKKFTKGAYVVVISNQEGVCTKKLVVQ